MSVSINRRKVTQTPVPTPSVSRAEVIGYKIRSNKVKSQDTTMSSSFDYVIFKKNIKKGRDSVVQCSVPPEVVY